MTGQPPLELLVWADGRTAPLVQNLLGRMGLVRVLAVGGPRKAQVADLAAAFEAPASDDLRAMLIETPPQYLLLACSSGVSAAELQQAQSSGTTVLAIEPMNFDTTELTTARPGSGAGLVLTAPWWRMSGSWLNAADPQQALGEIGSMQATCLGPAEAGSLFARLFDLMEMMIHLKGMPETVDASLTAAGGPAPDDLRRLTGHLTAHLRFGDGASAAVLASDRAPCWHRQLQILGDQGLLQLTDRQYHLLTNDGRMLDSSSAPGLPGVTVGSGTEADKPNTATPAKAGAKEWVDPAELIARQWRRLIDGSTPPSPAPIKHILASCQAVMLSCRTNGPESPATMLKLIS